MQLRQRKHEYLLPMIQLALSTLNIMLYLLHSCAFMLVLTVLTPVNYLCQVNEVNEGDNLFIGLCVCLSVCAANRSIRQFGR